MNIWSLCEGSQHLTTLKEEAWRVVEAQHILNSRDLVDSIEEYEILEALLDNSKPGIESKILDPLIFTPFRYPPLDYGSRFGRVFEPSLWYGSQDITTALTEVAYYRLKFNQDSEADLGYIDTLLTAFNVFVQTKQGIDLTKTPFSEYTADISSKNSYVASQLLGSEMRNSDIQAFVFYSARSKDKSKNLGVYTQDVFSSKQNQYTYNQQTWKCVSNKTDVQIARTDALGEQKSLTFNHHHF
ncbi:MAG: RES family NAD+ phosphorylase [Gammaproteobacteria bacterium]|nr:RES family NAD+ phosphorylase [Gammaproteobacteria bacterium]